MPNTFLIGSNSKNQIVLKGKYISPLHARLTEADGKIWIEDLQSTFGTHINGAAITRKTALKYHDRVRLGTQIFHWKDYIIIEKEKRVDEFHWKELFSPKGTVSLDNYKILIILAIGATIIIPIGIPVTLQILNIFIKSKGIPPLDVFPTSQILIQLTSIIGTYIFLNISQKAIKGLLKKTKSSCE